MATKFGTKLTITRSV